MPSSVLLTIASSEDSTIAPKRASMTELALRCSISRRSRESASSRSAKVFVETILFGSDAFGDVHAGRDHDGNAAGCIFDRHAGEIDHVFRAVGPGVARLTAEWLPRDGLHHCLPHPVLHL